MVDHVLVTGAAKRIGKHLALHLARQDFSVSIHYNHSRHDAHELEQEINKTGGCAKALHADFNNTQSIFNLEDRAYNNFGPITLLINNASVFEHDNVGQITDWSWERHFQPNLKAPIFLSQAMALRLPQTEKGQIINLIDQRVWALNPNFFSYTLTKSALWTATQTLAQALAPRIRVNAIGPGPTLANIRQTEDDFQAQVNATLLKTQPSLDEFAQAVDFLRQAVSVTGQMIALDSGQHLAWQTSDSRGIIE